MSPRLARRILASAKLNGDFITDLARVTCELSIALDQDLSEQEAAAYVKAHHGVEFDAEGNIIP